MRAITRQRYGGPEALELTERPVPEPTEGRVRLAVRASSLNPFEWHHMRGLPLMMRPMSGWRAPRDERLGVDVAGVVDAVGPGVEGIAVGDEMFGGAAGALAEYAVARAEYLAPKPPSVTFEQAAAAPLAGLTALQGLRDHGRMTTGARVLVLGASGGVGHYAVQLAKALGAERVVGSCSARNASLVTDLGADRVLDYAAGDVEALDEQFDVILDIAGGTPIAFLRGRLAPGGSLVLIGGPAGGAVLGPASRMFGGLITSRFRPERVVNFTARWSGADIAVLGEFLADGRLRSSIHRVAPLAETAAALAEVEAGHVPGKLVVVP
ncbi:NAD(P)-dependent alcohol dehydrogenase [Microbacterium awajiense]|uniref:NAD(P)-dependent alcohol dehydrogenase n=1 Tax=Microbacterium awajiense TaxID=415214 RepID=A0ABP7AY14_9MICO